MKEILSAQSDPTAKVVAFELTPMKFHESHLAIFGKHRILNIGNQSIAECVKFVIMINGTFSFSLTLVYLVDSDFLQLNEIRSIMSRERGY